MTLQEIKRDAVKTALINAIANAHEAQLECVDKLNKMDDYSRARHGDNWIKKFQECQQIIDEAFCELFNPKPKAQ